MSPGPHAVRGQPPCDNLNHRRSPARVRHCPGCGVLVNQMIRAEKCGELQHAEARRHRDAFCAECGGSLR